MYKRDLFEGGVAVQQPSLGWLWVALKLFIPWATFEFAPGLFK